MPNNDLPFSELFPHVHPLDRQLSAQEIIKEFPFLSDWQENLNLHHNLILNEDYLNTDKINKSLGFLCEHYGKKNPTDAIPSLIKEYGSFNPNTGRMTERVGKDISLFWVCETSAFLLINEFIKKNGDDIKSHELIRQCFSSAGTLKCIWQHSGLARSKGGNSNYREKREDKEAFIETLANDAGFKGSFFSKNYAGRIQEIMDNCKLSESRAKVFYSEQIKLSPIFVPTHKS